MTKPSNRELAQILKLEKLSPRDTSTLLQILTVLGFDFETIALLWGKNVAVATKAFMQYQLSGHDLALFCKHINVRPGVIQQKLNFDESPLRRTKHGFKSRTKVLSWVGPPELCITGAAPQGRAFREVYCLPAVSGRLSSQSTLQREVLNQIAKGLFPVRFHVLREVISTWKETGIDHQKGVLLERVLALFPKDVQSAEDIFAPAKTTLITTSEVPMGGAMKRFVEHCVAQRIGPEVYRLVSILQLKGWTEEHFQWDEKRLARLKSNEEGVPKHTLELLVEELARHKRPPEAETAYRHITAFLRGKMVLESESASVAPKLPEKILGKHGEIWFPHKQQVRIEGNTLSVTGDGENSLSKRVFAAINTIRIHLAEDWSGINAAIGITRETALSMTHGTWVADAARIEFLLSAIKRGVGIELSLEQLCGLKPIVFDKAEQSPQWLFELSDTRTAAWWVVTLRKYRAVHGQFKKVYGITTDYEEHILTGKIGVPLAVHHYLLHLIEVRLHNVQNPVLPRAYQSLLKMSQSQFDRQQFVEPFTIPHKNWLQSQ